MRVYVLHSLIILVYVSSIHCKGYQGLREGKRHLIPFPRVGKRQSLIPFPRVGKSFREPEELDDDAAIGDAFIIHYPTGDEVKQLNESPIRPNAEYDVDYKNVVPVGVARHQGMFFIPQWLLNQDEQ